MGGFGQAVPEQPQALGVHVVVVHLPLTSWIEQGWRGLGKQGSGGHGKGPPGEGPSS
ncbi:hypothetical protein Acsp03_32800 [Actinomadura sp. NBRC 104412]|nr:hypothetical protein Acsp03_32800 [Actinomadura sp. NBRC 104412]